MNLVLTGGTGYIGNMIVPKLSKEYNKVFLITKNKAQYYSHYQYGSNVKIIHIEDKKAVFDIFKSNKIDCFINLMGLLTSKFDSADVFNTIRMVNVEIPLYLIEQAIKYDVKNIIHVSTYLDRGYFGNEINNILPRDYYSFTKGTLSKFLFYLSKQLHLNTVVLRLGNVYGCNMSKDRVVPSIIDSFANNKEITINCPKQEIDLIHVSDVVSAILKTVKFIFDNNDLSSYREFDICSGRFITVEELYNLIKSKYRADSNHYRVKYDNKNHILFHPLINVKYAIKNLKWKPLKLLDNGLDEMVSEI